MAQDLPGRRAFLGTAGGAALAASLFPGSVRGANDRLAVAFIGVGRMGSENIGLAASVPGIAVAAVCDIDRPALERAEAQARRLGFAGVKARRDFRDLLADKSIDAVCLATPDRWHAYLAVDACKAGKDVYVETPSFVYLEEGARMVEAARKYKRVVQAGTAQRSGALFRRARDIVKSGALGDISFCRVFDYSGGGLPASGVHLLDIVQWTFDEAMPVSVAAQGGRDTLLATYRYPGFIASYESRGANPLPLCDAVSGTVFHGAKATLMVNRAGYALYPGEKGGALLQEHGESLRALHVAHWRNFAECVRTREKPASDIETCVRSTATCVLANLSHRHGLTLDWDDKAFTVKQAAVRPSLRAPYRAPWKLEV
jgi:predicted dehydrogenase